MINIYAEKQGVEMLLTSGHLKSLIIARSSLWDRGSPGWKQPVSQVLRTISEALSTTTISYLQGNWPQFPPSSVWVCLRGAPGPWLKAHGTLYELGGGAGQDAFVWILHNYHNDSLFTSGAQLHSLSSFNPLSSLSLFCSMCFFFP